MPFSPDIAYSINYALGKYFFHRISHFLESA
ncbi:hypothetical protein O6U65_1867 [Saccharomyces cerevisiae synthetic construct]|uniref:Putative uncharacterized protein YLR299C-A n=1 Tax=Saccharomyces cerevisiae (strain ATCC 204508 / S288c) TaxID=559292 RepID=YL299_YEAST|nr:RecName: Full=Putative uncharacterized protein YLR299C-A [Saccharomyces cerevisiae S288C]AAL79280.1 unknown [Saccharomyces cerevisiae]WNV73005.1 hypothetical protein O6U65_1867 [Saccharomyces cerevisiae synthetic construct]